MDQRTLEAFVVVADELHFGRAAERLHVSTSPLSQTIRRLEKELGVDLFERTTRSVTLTSQGVAFLPYARRIISEMSASRAAARNAKPGSYGTVTLAFSGALNHKTLPLLAQAVRQRYPDIELRLAGGFMSMAALQQLLRGTADVAFVGLPVTADDVAVIPVSSESIGIVLPADHPAAGEPEHVIELASLQQQPFLMPAWNSGSSLREVSIQTCRRAGFRPRIVQEVNDTYVMLALCAAGVGLALQPETMRDLVPPGVVYRTLDEVAVLGSGFAWAPGRLSPAARTVVALAKETLAVPDYVENHPRA